MDINEIQLREGEHYQGALKRQWLSQQSLTWARGPVEYEEIPRQGPSWKRKRAFAEEYTLTEKEAVTAFKELAECISNPGLIQLDQTRPDIFGKHSPTLFPEWIKDLGAQENGNDTENVRRWVEKWGFPIRRDYHPGWGERMWVDDILVIAHLACTAYNLFNHGLTLKGRYKIKDLAVISPAIEEIGIYFGVSKEAPLKLSNTSYPQDLAVIFVGNADLRRLTRSSWRQIAWLWLARICEQMINVEIQVPVTGRCFLRPVIAPIGLLSWLWFHFLGYIGEVYQAKEAKEGEKTCGICEKIFTDAESKSPYCPDCRQGHKNALKYKSYQDKQRVLSLLTEGKSVEEIAVITKLEIKRIQHWKEVFDNRSI